LAKAPSEKTLDELAEDMHTRPGTSWRRRRLGTPDKRPTYMFVASIAMAVSAAAAAITAGIAAYVAFHGG